MDLQKAIKTQSLDTIKKILEIKGIPIDQDWKDYELLNEAVKLGRGDVAKYLLTKNCRVNKAANSNADTPLHHAIKLKDLDLVQSLLEKKASVEILNDDGDSPLHLAFINEQSSIVDVLLFYIKQNSLYTNPRNQQGLSHLHIASTREDKVIIEKFLENGADASESVNEDSVMWAEFTALHFAVHYKSVGAVNVLASAIRKLGFSKSNSIKDSCAKLVHKEIEKSLMIADLISLIPSSCKGSPLYDPRYNSYFHMALSRGDIDSVKSFIANGVAIKVSPYPLHLAVESDCKENIELLLNHGADINVRNENNMTPVHLALYNEDKDEKNTIVDQLYSAFEEAKEDYTDSNGLSYLHVAVTRNDLETVKYYLNTGDDVNKQVLYKQEKFYHFSPLHFAALYKKNEVAELLINYGANVNLSDDGRYGTPLHIAVQTDNADLIELLLENGADVKAIQPWTKKTVLHLLQRFVFLFEKPEPKTELLVYVDRFVTMGCDINAQDYNGDTVLHTCTYFVPSLILQLSIARLLEHGADINLQNGYGWTPLRTLDICLLWVRDCCESFMLLYDHVQKLKALGMMIHPNNIECCDKYLEMVQKCETHSKDLKDRLSCAEKERLDEINKMKKTFISDDKKSSLYDLLISNPIFINISFLVSLLEEIIKNEDFDKLYPSYGYLIRLQCKRLYECKGVKVSQKRYADGVIQRKDRAKRPRTRE